MRSGGASRPSRGCTGSRARPCCPRREGGSRSESLRPLHHVEQPPALGPRQRTALDHAHHVALARVVGLIVRVQRARASDDLLVATMAACDIDSNGDRLRSLVRDHDTLPHSPLALPRWVNRGKLSRGSTRGRPLFGFRAFAHAPHASTRSLPRALGATLGLALLGRTLRARLDALRARGAAALLRRELLALVLDDHRCGGPLSVTARIRIGVGLRLGRGLRLGVGFWSRLRLWSRLGLWLGVGLWLGLGLWLGVGLWLGLCGVAVAAIGL